MPWPKVIAQGGRGSNRTGLVPRPRSDTKRAFMHEVVLIMLQTSPHVSLEIMALNAEKLFNEVEKRTKHE